MNLGRPLDTPDALAYLNLIEIECSADCNRHLQFISLISHWTSEPESCNSINSSTIYHLIDILKRPKLIRDLNSILPNGYRIDCLTDVDAVEFVVLGTPTGAEILSHSPHTEVPKPSSTDELAVYLAGISQADIDKLLRHHSRQWLSCFSQLLQWETDACNSDPRYEQKLRRLQRKLAKGASILPPSLFLHNVTRIDKFPVSGGGFADIFEGEIVEHKVCLKVLRPYRGTNYYENQMKAFGREILAWSRPQHPNVLPFLGANKGLFASFCLISPWMKNGNIMTYLKSHPDHDRLVSVVEIVRGLSYLHGLTPPIFHRDIKGANILVSDDGHCCVADFGLAFIPESRRQESNSLGGAGSVRWQAPEIINPSDVSWQNDPGAGDVYALACTIAEIFSGKVPFAHLIPDGAVIMAIVRGEKPGLVLPGVDYAKELRTLVESCWESKPAARPVMKEVERRLGSLRPIATINSNF